MAGAEVPAATAAEPPALDEAFRAAEEDAIMNLVDLFTTPGDPSRSQEKVYAFGTYLLELQQPDQVKQPSNMELAMTMAQVFGMTNGQAVSIIRTLRMNKQRVTCARLYQHIKAAPSPPHDPTPVPYAVVAGAGDTRPPKTRKAPVFRTVKDEDKGLVHMCEIHGWTTHTTRLCNDADPAMKARAQAAYEAEVAEAAQLRQATQLSLVEARRQEIARKVTAGEQLTKAEVKFLATGTDGAGPSTEATVDLPPPPAPISTGLEVSLGPDLHLDLTNLSATRGARIQLPNPEPFDGDLRKLVPDVYRTPADYILALASTAIRADMPLPEITKMFFKGTAKTWQHQIWIELKHSSFPTDDHCLTDQRYTKRLAVLFLFKFEQHFSAQLRQRSSVAMESFLNDSYHQRQGESVALYFARFSTEVQEAGGFTELQKVTYFRAGLRPDIRKWSAVDQEGREFVLLSDLFQQALAQERRSQALSGTRATVALLQPTLAYVQGGRSGRGGGRAGRAGRPGGRDGGGRSGGRDRDFTGRASGGVQKSRHNPAAPRDRFPGGPTQQGYAQGPARDHGRGPALVAPSPGMKWAAIRDGGTFRYEMVPSASGSGQPQPWHSGAEHARGRGSGSGRGRGRSPGRGGKYRVALIDNVHHDDIPLPPSFDLHYDAGADGR
jgi:hypothetical protein